jgi:XTP/dITP diphosphohydrolase
MSGDVLLLATRSAGKLRELRPLFAFAGLNVVSLDEIGLAECADEDDLECHDTFEANALAKARYFHERSGGMPTVADDSGLEVAALGGEPGVRSKRWSGAAATGHALDAANNALLQLRLADHADRSARFVCAAAFVGGDVEIVRRGETAGEIVAAAEGASGFGYDPYFHSTELGVTFGVASIAQKERVSHRGRAFRALVGDLKARTDPLGDDSAAGGNELR